MVDGRESVAGNDLGPRSLKDGGIVTTSPDHARKVGGCERKSLAEKEGRTAVRGGLVRCTEQLGWITVSTDECKEQ